MLLNLTKISSNQVNFDKIINIWLILYPVDEHHMN